MSGLVGTLPGAVYRRAPIRQMVNPLDKCTVFSIYPRQIIEFKPTIEPGRFIIEKGSFKTPAKLVVGPSSWWKETDENMPILEIPQSSIIVAQAIVRDYMNGLLGCDMERKMPGLWYEEGEKDAPNPDIMARMKVRQDAWFSELLLIGDTLWARTQGNPLSIDDNMRMAALELGIKDKPWLKDFSTKQLENCPMCGTLRNPEFPMCPNCKHIVDEKKAKEIGIKFSA